MTASVLLTKAIIEKIIEKENNSMTILKPAELRMFFLLDFFNEFIFIAL